MIEGQLTIDVKRDQSETQVKIISSRPLHAAQLLVGKSPEQSFKIVPLLFNICGIAQSYNAFVVLNAGKIHNQKGWQILVKTETLKEHLLRLFLDAPKLLNIKPAEINLAFVAQLVKQMQNALFTGGDVFDFKNKLTINKQQAIKFIDGAEEFLENHVFFIPIKQWQQIKTFQDLVDWSQSTNTIAAQAIKTIIDRQWSSQAQVALRALPSLSASDLESVLRNSNALSFIAQPSWKKQTYETTPLTRQNGNSLIEDLQGKFGTGLLSRWVARLLEISVMPSQMRDLLENNSETIESTNISQIEAARGRLIHRALVEDNAVKTYQIVAPTEWNFHPHGVVVESLKNIKTKSEEEYKKIAHCVINAIDPCVGYELRVS